MWSAAHCIRLLLDDFSKFDVINKLASSHDDSQVVIDIYKTFGPNLAECCSDCDVTDIVMSSTYS